MDYYNSDSKNRNLNSRNDINFSYNSEYRSNKNEGDKHCADIDERLPNFNNNER